MWKRNRNFEIKQFTVFKMKNIFFSIIAFIAVAVVTISCNQTSNKKNEQVTEDSTVIAKNENLPIAEHNNKNSVVPTIDTIAKKIDKVVAEEQVQKFSISPIIKDYLAVKNALIADNDKASSTAGKKLLATLNSVDMKLIPANKHNQYMEIVEDAKENAEHIGENAGKIDHQREHLASLSKDIADLIELFGTSQKLYLDHCPMYNEGKGAVWISEAKAIKNPYYGSKMLSCGSVKKEI